jgi:hypothetical protein
MYWIAINRSSCAMCSIPMDQPPIVSPTPELLVGFPTLAEAKAAQTLCLTAPINKVQAALTRWQESEDIVIHRCVHPQKPRATTEWKIT